MIVIAWFSIGLISQSFGSGFPVIQISRGTGSYHGYMAIILFVGYAIVIIKNLNQKSEQIPILKLLFIGIIVQFSWESALLISGIRPLDWNPLIINSLLETNLGLPYLYFIHKAIISQKKSNNDLVLETD